MPTSSSLSIRQCILRAQYPDQVDLFLKNCPIVNVFTNDIISDDIAVTGDWISSSFKELLLAPLDQGCQTPAPFIALNFLSLPVGPELKLIAKGPMDVSRSDFVLPWSE